MRKPEPTAQEDRIGKQVVDAVFHVHKNLGVGLLEGVYETCLCHELEKRNLSFERQPALPIEYDGIQLDGALRLDVLVEGRVICELNAVVEISDLHLAQLLTYLRLSKLRLGYLINFNVPRIKDGIKRVIG